MKSETGGKYGIKAYGHTTMFKTKAAFRNYLMDWICNTEGAERDRASTALSNLETGIPFTDTDAPQTWSEDSLEESLKEIQGHFGGL